MWVELAGTSGIWVGQRQWWGADPHAARSNPPRGRARASSCLARQTPAHAGSEQGWVAAALGKQHKELRSELGTRAATISSRQTHSELYEAGQLAGGPSQNIVRPAAALETRDGNTQMLRCLLGWKVVHLPAGGKWVSVWSVCRRCAIALARGRQTQMKLHPGLAGRQGAARSRCFCRHLGQGKQSRASSGTTATWRSCSEPLTWTSAGTHRLELRQRDGRLPVRPALPFIV
jgi:hypothetical protein